MYKIFLRNDVSYLCEDEETILGAALRNGIVLDHSCLLGRCSSCKFKVLSGITNKIDEEISLSDSDINKGFILACVRKPISDVYLDTDDLSSYGLTKVRTYPIKVNSFEYVTNSILKIELRLPPNQAFTFKEGQYINIIYGEIKRSYSLANSSNNNVITLFVKNYANGLMSNYWFNIMKKNDLLRFEGPKGTFFLRNHIEAKTLIFIATGTGIAPIKSIFESEDFDIKASSFNRIILLWGMRYKTDIFWSPPFDKKINFIPVFSKEQNNEYVQDALMNLNISFDTSVIYLCGSSLMVDQVKLKLLNTNFKFENLFYDTFVQTN